jgi:hypothetical protein
MITLRRRSVAARSGIVAGVIGVLAIASLSGAAAATSATAATPAPTPTPNATASPTATVSASPSATDSPSAPATVTVTATKTVTASPPASGAEGDTKCVPWPKPTSLGLRCTGSYSGNTAWNPWTWNSISQQPVVTVSQAKDLTDQGVQITWSDFTPSLDSNSYTPNPSSINPLYQVSIFECEGTNPDPSSGFGPPQCYTPPVGSPLADSGPANGLVENTIDTSSPPKSDGCPASSNYPVPSSVLCDYTTLPYKSKWNGGNPATWTGQADFHVEAPTPRSLGGFFNCSASNPCSLVIVPNWGGTPEYDANTSEFSWSNTSTCGEHWLGEGIDPTPSQYKKDPDLLGDPNPDPNNNPSIGYDQGDLMGVAAPDEFPFGQTNGLSGNGGVAPLQAASYACWSADRIVIPLSFAPTPNDCPSTTPAFYVQGSPMMETQMLQWEAGWCVGGDPVALDYTANSESVAREDFLAGGQVGGARADMALVTQPATAAQKQASSRQFTYAPLANSGVGIAYLVDDPRTGSQIDRMVLDPRLLAKLITESYTLQYGCTRADHTQESLTCDPAVWGDGKNAYSLFDDPEFLSLNRQCQPYGESANYTCTNPSDGTNEDADDFPPNITASGGTATGDFLPTVLEPDSDMNYDLTGWIAANADAAAFLSGTPDPWGMVVNSDYLNVTYPAEAFPILDNGYTLPITCSNLGCPTNDLDVTMQAAWNPQPDLDTITIDLLTDQPSASSPTDGCPSVNGCLTSRELTLTSALSPQLLGSRDLLAELDLGDIAGYQFPAAELINGAGKAVGPTQASVEAAVNDMKTNPDGITQYFDFSSTDPAAYPLSMVDYAMVPTCGLSHTEASAIADFLTKAATTGQVQGEAPGDLAPGYYPLNAKQKAQTLEAAQEVSAQTCKSTPHHTTKNNATASPSASPSTTPAGGHQSPSPSTTGRAETLAFGEKSADSGLAGLLLLLAIIVGLLVMVVGPTAWVITVTGRWPVVLGWAPTVGTRLRTGLGRLAGRVVRRS